MISLSTCQKNCVSEREKWRGHFLRCPLHVEGGGGGRGLDASPSSPPIDAHGMTKRAAVPYQWRHVLDYKKKLRQLDLVRQLHDVHNDDIKLGFIDIIIVYLTYLTLS